MKRSLMGKQPLIEVFEEITSSREWTPPPGCISVDAFVVGGGNDGVTGDHLYAGPGGNAGECLTYENIEVDNGPIMIVVGAKGSDSYFKSNSYIAKGGLGKTGASRPNYQAGYYAEGIDGKDGVFPFNNKYPNRFTKKYGASGASGAAETNAIINGHGSQGQIVKGGNGGDFGGGNGGDIVLSTSSMIGGAGGDASYYGAGGGGSGKRSGSYGSSLSGGKGYQGIVILHYWKYKL